MKFSELSKEEQSKLLIRLQDNDYLYEAFKYELKKHPNIKFTHEWIASYVEIKDWQFDNYFA